MAIIHGGGIVVSRLVNGSYRAFAAARSCEIEVTADEVESCGSTDAQWRRSVAGKKSWKVTVSGLTTAMKGTLLQSGGEFSLKVSTGGADYVVGVALCRNARVTATDGNLSQYGCTFIGKGALDMFDDPLVQLLWTGGSVSRSSVPAGETAILNEGSVTAVYQSGRQVNVNDMATFFASRGRVAGNVYTAPSTSGSDSIGVSYGGLTASTTISITVTAVVQSVAYIGGGTSVSGVAIAANRKTNFGSGSVAYSVAVAANNYIYVLLPSGTPFVDMCMSDFPMWYEQLSDTTIDGVTYTVRRSLPLYAGSYQVVVRYS